MATSKSLQVPQVVDVVGSTIRIGHPNILGYTSTALAAPIAASGTAASFRDNNNFADNDWLIVGVPGTSQCEEVDVNGAVTRGTSITLTNSLKFGHELDAPVTKIYERGIKIYGAATDGGAGTLIASVDAISSPIADAVMIQWNQPYTEYTLISTDTAYAYYYVKFTDGTTDSDASDYVAAAGLNANSVEYMTNQALTLTETRIDNSLITREMLIKWAQDAQDAIAQFVYQDPQTGKQIQKNWSFETTLDETIAAVQGQSKYSLASLATALKYPSSDYGIISVRIGTTRPRIKTQIEQLDRYMQDKAFTRLNGAATSGATTLTVDSTADFESSGTINVGSDTITYTGKNSTTFTGIPASGTGSITSNWVDNSEVWNGNTQGLPTMYCYDENLLQFDKPIDSNNSGKLIKVRYFGALPRLTKVSDETTVPFYNVFQWYISGQIERRKDNHDKAQMYHLMFTDQVLKNALADKVPTTDEQVYYNFQDPIDATTRPRIDGLPYSYYQW